jgi:hypothetical protein
MPRLSNGRNSFDPLLAGADLYPIEIHRYEAYATRRARASDFHQA